MPNILTVGFVGEGPTDERFYKPLLRRTFEELAFDCQGEIDVYEPQMIKKESGTFVEMALAASKHAAQFGLNVLCLHADSDAPTETDLFVNKFKPAKAQIDADPTALRNIVPLIPIQMTEAWMLADIDLLLSEMRTTRTAFDLKLHRNPESYADPKAVIMNAIENCDCDQRWPLSIAQLYQILGQRIDLSKLRHLDSYLKFESRAKDSLKLLGYLH